MAFVNILNILYPVGSLYFSTNRISPASVVGGQWELLTDSFYPEYLISDKNWSDNWISTDQESRTKMVNGIVTHYGNCSSNFSIPADEYTPFTTLQSKYAVDYDIPFVCHNMGGV